MEPTERTQQNSEELELELELDVDRTFVDCGEPTSETMPVTTREPDAYGLSYSEPLGFEVMPYDRWGKPIHHHPLNARPYPTPSEAYEAIRAFERDRAA